MIKTLVGTPDPEPPKAPVPTWPIPITTAVLAPGHVQVFTTSGFSQASVVWR